MSISSDYNVILTDYNGHHAPGNIVYMQQIAERWREDVAEVHVATSEQLPYYYYEAIFYADAQPLTGSLVIHKRQSADGTYLFECTLYTSLPLP